MVYNCAFHHCTMGIVQAWHVGNNFMWHVDNCQFEDCDYGINFFDSACNDVDNCHFEKSKVCDVMGGHSMHVRHCTSRGSARFYASKADCPLSPDVLEDCWVDGWADPTGAVHFDIEGPDLIFDCHFTNPPPNAGPPINLKPLTNLPSPLLMSNNHEGAQTDATLVNKIASDVMIIPPGKRGSVLTSAAQTFLHPSYQAESTHLIDVTHAPYSADATFKTDAAPGIQAAIDAARKANDGTIVYLPGGMYRVGSTIKVLPGNYVVTGEGFMTMLCYVGARNTSVFAVTDPVRMTLRDMRIAVPPGQNVASIRETATKPGRAVFDEISSSGLNLGNPGASGDANHEPGIVLDHLPAGSKVYLPHVDTPITALDSGAAQIFAKYLAIGMINVSGAGPKGGFMGAQVLEGGQQQGTGHNIVVTDNQDLTIGDYYSEQCGNDLVVSRGAGTQTGHIAIQGFLSASGNNNGSGQATTTIEVDNYAGRVFYGSSIFANYNGSLPVQVTQHGANPVDLVLAAVTFNHTAPAIKTEPSATLVGALNVIDAPYPGVSFPDQPNPLTDASKRLVGHGLDDMRALESMDLSVEDGIGSGR